MVLILLDDTGFAQFGCYGSDIDTPNIDALANNGVQFTNFHVTPVCSPTRAALLTGRSQHEVGMRGLAGWVTGFPNALGHVSNAAATVADGFGPAAVSREAQDKELAARLWERSSAVVGLGVGV